VLCLGNISGRALYALRMTRTFAVFAIAESVIYFGYNAALVRWVGVTGAAIAYLIYCFGSLGWQLVLIRRVCGGRSVLPVRSGFRTLIAAVGGGIGAAGVNVVVANPWVALMLG